MRSSNVVFLPTGYQPQEERTERPVRRSVIARTYGVDVSTVDNWVSRDGMPEDKPGQWGCWFQAGAQRRYYPERVRTWLAARRP